MSENKPKTDAERIKELEATITRMRAMMDHSFSGSDFVVYGTKDSIAALEKRMVKWRLAE